MLSAAPGAHCLPPPVPVSISRPPVHCRVVFHIYYQPHCEYASEFLTMNLQPALRLLPHALHDNLQHSDLHTFLQSEQAHFLLMLACRPGGRVEL